MFAELALPHEMRWLNSFLCWIWARLILKLMPLCNKCHLVYQLPHSKDIGVIWLPIRTSSSFRSINCCSIPICAISKHTEINDIGLIKIATAQKLVPNVARLVIANTCQVSTLPFPLSWSIFGAFLPGTFLIMKETNNI